MTKAQRRKRLLKRRGESTSPDETRRSLLRCIPAALVGLPLLASPAFSEGTSSTRKPSLPTPVIEVVTRPIDVPQFACYRYDTWAHYASNLVRSNIPRRFADILYENKPARMNDLVEWTGYEPGRFDRKSCEIDMNQVVESGLPYGRFLQEVLRPSAESLLRHLRRFGADADLVVTRPIDPESDFEHPRTPIVYHQEGGLCVSAMVMERSSGRFYGSLDMMLAFRWRQLAMS